MNGSRLFHAGLLAISCCLVPLGGCVVAPAPYYADVAPPAPREEIIGVAPSVGFVWLGGYWDWAGRGYEWRPGHWEAPRPGYRWAPHRWEQEGRHWRHGGGRWEREH